MKIAFLGGGSFGGNLAQLLAQSGHDVVVGLRDTGRARSGATYRCDSFEHAIAHGEVVVIALPYLVCATVLPKFAGQLSGKIVVDATNPLREDWSPLPLGAENSAAEELSRLLPSARLVKAFNTIFADIIRAEQLEQRAERLTAFIAGDDLAANRIIAEIAASAGFAPLVTGRLGNARYLEAMANLNIQIAVVHGGGTNAGYVYRQHL